MLLHLCSRFNFLAHFPFPAKFIIGRNWGRLLAHSYPIYRQNLGWSRKSKIPDRLGFSRHMKKRLYLIHRQNLGWSEERKIPDCLGFFFTSTISIHSWWNNRPFLGFFLVFLVFCFLFFFCFFFFYLMAWTN